MSIGKNIQDAIKTIVEQAVIKAPFDKTRYGIVRNIDADTGTYTIQVDGVTYNKIKSTKGLSISKGDVVLVLLPSNNASQMIIYGLI